MSDEVSEMKKVILVGFISSAVLLLLSFWFAFDSFVTSPDDPQFSIEMAKIVQGHKFGEADNKYTYIFMHCAIIIWILFMQTCLYLYLPTFMSKYRNKIDAYSGGTNLTLKDLLRAVIAIAFVVSATQLIVEKSVSDSVFYHFAR